MATGDQKLVAEHETDDLQSPMKLVKKAGRIDQETHSISFQRRSKGRPGRLTRLGRSSPQHNPAIGL